MKPVLSGYVASVNVEEERSRVAGYCWCNSASGYKPTTVHLFLSTPGEEGETTVHPYY